MSVLQQLIGKVRLQLRGRNHIVGWRMTPEETISFFRRQGKITLTFFGYTVKYQDKEVLFRIVRDVLAKYSPEKTLVNAGATGSMGDAVYTVARSMGFTTTGIVSELALAYPDDIRPNVDHICFIKDKTWGGKLPNSEELSSTSKAMVECSDILVAIGGNDIARDELLEGRLQGKPIQYFPAEMNHDAAIRRAKHLGLPPPESFMGSVHDGFGK